MLILGCDPGLTGALALVDSARGLLECEDLPVCSNGSSTGSMKEWLDVKGLTKTLSGWSTRHGFAAQTVHSFIERPIAMPTLPAQTIASQFDTFGVLRAVLMRAGALTVVNPKEWKGLFGLSSDKNASRATAKALYREAPVKLVKHHNRAEAILIAHYGRVELS